MHEIGQRKALKEKSRLKAQLKRYYGITVEQYNAMFAYQNGACAICGKPESEQSRKLSVDHNHETGAVRGLLCDNCNHAIGMFQDDIDLLQKAINYLKMHQSWD